MITKTSSSTVEVDKWIFTSMDDQIDKERHLLYILLDSNLPTGGFVASSGLESYSKHGFLSSNSTSQHLTPQEAVVRFAERSVTNYASSTLGFVRDAWAGLDKGSIEEIIRLDEMYEAMTLNHVTRRSSTAQGVALLTLLTKGFSVPIMPNLDVGSQQEDSMLEYKTTINTFKLRIRRGEAHGHLPVCWGLLTRAMGLSLDRAVHLHLYLHVRAILSSAVRLNLIGPYASTQLLLHPLQQPIDQQARLSGHAHSGVLEKMATSLADTTKKSDEWAWAEEDESAPSVVWPLGELLMCRHDMQHTRIFNS